MVFFEFIIIGFYFLVVCNDLLAHVSNLERMGKALTRWVRSVYGGPRCRTPGDQPNHLGYLCMSCLHISPNYMFSYRSHLAQMPTELDSCSCSMVHLLIFLLYLNLILNNLHASNSKRVNWERVVMCKTVRVL